YNGKVLIKNLVDNIIILREDMEKVQPNKNKMEKIFNKSETKYNIRKEDFYKSFDEIMLFTESLFSVKKQISEEKIELEDKERYLKLNFDRLKKELKDIENYIQNLKIENGKYEFLVNKIEPILLKSDIIQNLPYNRKSIISSTIAEMEELKI